MRHRFIIVILSLLVTHIMCVAQDDDVNLVPMSTGQQKVFKGKCEKLLEGDPKEKEPIAEQIKKEIEDSKCKACFFQAEEYYFEPLQDKINVLKAEEAEKAAAEAAAAAKAAKLAKKKAMMAKKKKK